MHIRKRLDYRTMEKPPNYIACDVCVCVWKLKSFMLWMQLVKGRMARHLARSFWNEIFSDSCMHQWGFRPNYNKRRKEIFHPTKWHNGSPCGCLSRVTTWNVFIFFPVEFSLSFVGSLWVRVMLRKTSMCLLLRRRPLMLWYHIQFGQSNVVGCVNAFLFVNGRHLSLIFCNVNFLIPSSDKSKVHSVHNTHSIRSVTNERHRNPQTN